MADPLLNKRRPKTAQPTQNPGRYLPNGKLNIAGRWCSPGPKYMLPSCMGYNNHDTTLNRRPAYTIGSKWSKLRKSESSPGPIYFPNSKVFITGKSESPAYSLAGRHKPFTFSIGPGPASYSPERHVDPRKTSAPACSIGIKHKDTSGATHPVAPNQYFLPNTIGTKNFNGHIKTAPAYSIASRHELSRMDNGTSRLYNPGIDFVKSSTPKWTIIGRANGTRSELAYRQSLPGPNQYDIDVKSCYSRYRASPAITLGIRHSEFCSTGFAT